MIDEIESQVADMHHHVWTFSTYIYDDYPAVNVKKCRVCGYSEQTIARSGKLIRITPGSLPDY